MSSTTFIETNIYTNTAGAVITAVVTLVRPISSTSAVSSSSNSNVDLAASPVSGSSVTLLPPGPTCANAPNLYCRTLGNGIVETFSASATTIFNGNNQVPATTYVQVFPSSVAASTVITSNSSETSPIPGSVSGSQVSSGILTSPTLPRSTESSATATGTAANATNGASRSEAGSNTNTGAIAGAAIGGLVAGALIVGLIAFMLLKKRSRKDRYVSHNTYVPTTSPVYGGEKGMPMVSIASTAGMDFLPQQADDAEVKHRLSTVVDQIDQHVENFYSHRAAPLNPAQEAEISRFETSELPLPLAACFQNSTAATTLIKHCLAYHIFNMTMTPSENSNSILPSEIAGVVKAMYHRSLSPTVSKDTLTAFGTWKSLTRYLQPELGRDQSTARALSESSARVANQFTNVFSPWAHAQYNDDSRARHLTDLINQAAQTAIWLFGQPDSYKFEWDVPNIRQTRNYTAVVVPAVWKTTHNGSRLNGKGQSVLAPVIREF